ncbi:MAG: PLP-dependent transferase [Planctomycetes bacterium]|nr:PLP-dependent transferase [Planctomycetota bacterium]NOG53727.1 PLP-dependent transferase [Planctomycetota bacterium]
MEHTNARIETRVIHAGQQPDPITGAVMPPVSLSSTYIQKSPGQHAGYEYSRSHNPTRYALERSVAALEGAHVADDPSHGGLAFSSGMAATGTVLELLSAGDHLIAMDDLYGGTNRLFSQVRQRSQGLMITYLDMTSGPDALEQAITDRTKMIWVETPTNPTLKLVDLTAVAQVAARHGIISVCDNTFATPMLQRPLAFGFDIVAHSATKYLGGHSDVVGGLTITNRPDLQQRLRFLQNSVGSILSPFDSYLVLRGIKTLALRMQRHCENAQQIAEWLEQHPRVTRVTYPGLPSHPQRDLARRNMFWVDEADGTGRRPAGGGMITIWLDGGLDESRRFLEAVKLISLAESLGGVESLIEHPAIMTHASVPPDQRRTLGIDDNMCRLSVGIESVDDLLADLEAAFKSI